MAFARQIRNRIKCDLWSCCNNSSNRNFSGLLGYLYEKIATKLLADSYSTTRSGWLRELNHLLNKREHPDNLLEPATKSRWGQSVSASGIRILAIRTQLSLRTCRFFIGFLT